MYIKKTLRITSENKKQSYRPAYLFDDVLKASADKVKEIIEREEREQQLDKLSYGGN